MNVRPKLTAAVLFLLAAGAGRVPAGGGRATEQPVLTLTASPSAVAYGVPTNLRAQGRPPGAELTLSRKRAGEADFTAIGSAVADAAGVAEWTRTPPQSAVFRVDLAEGAGWSAAFAEVTVGVRPRVALTVAAPQAAARGPVRALHGQGAAGPPRRDRAAGALDGRRLGSAQGPHARRRLAGHRPHARRLARDGSSVRADMAADVDHLAGHSLPWKVTVYDRRNPYGMPTRLPHLILVDLSQYKLYYHEHGNIVRVFDCVLGRPSLPTPRATTGSTPRTPT